MNFEQQKKENISSEYQELIQAELDSDNAPDPESAKKNVELALFNERIEQFAENDLVQDEDGTWNTFEQKVRQVFPEIPESSFRAMKAAVTMHLCGQ